MGQARQRGTYAERKSEAVAHVENARRNRKDYLRKNPQKRHQSYNKLATIMGMMAMSGTYLGV